MHVIIFFRNECQAIYSALLRTLIRLQRTNELLNVAERGRAQALNDIMKLQYSEWLACGSIEPEGRCPTLQAILRDIFIAGDIVLLNFFIFFVAIAVPKFFLSLSCPFYRPFYSRFILRFIFILTTVKSWMLIMGKAWKWGLDQL